MLGMQACHITPLTDPKVAGICLFVSSVSIFVSSYLSMYLSTATEAKKLKATEAKKPKKPRSQKPQKPPKPPKSRSHRSQEATSSRSHGKKQGQKKYPSQTHLSAAKKRNKINKCRSPWPCKLKKCADCSSMVRPIVSAMRHGIPRSQQLQGGCCILKMLRIFCACYRQTCVEQPDPRATFLGPPKCHVEGKPVERSCISFAPVFELCRQYVWMKTALCHEGPMWKATVLSPSRSFFNILSCHGFAGNLACNPSMMLLPCGSNIESKGKQICISDFTWLFSVSPRFCHVDQTSKVKESIYASQILQGFSLFRHAFVRVTCGRKVTQLMQQKLTWLTWAGNCLDLPPAIKGNDSGALRSCTLCRLCCSPFAVAEVRPGITTSFPSKRAGWMVPPSKPPEVSPALSLITWATMKQFAISTRKLLQTLFRWKITSLEKMGLSFRKSLVGGW